jgi:hypothetical protein
LGVSERTEEILVTTNNYRPRALQHPARPDSRFSIGALYLYLVLEAKTKDELGVPPELRTRFVLDKQLEF